MTIKDECEFFPVSRAQVQAVRRRNRRDPAAKTGGYRTLNPVPPNFISSWAPGPLNNVPVPRGSKNPLPPLQLAINDDELDDLDDFVEAMDADDVVQNARDFARARQRRRERAAAEAYRAGGVEGLFDEENEQFDPDVPSEPIDRVQNAREFARARQRVREMAAARNYREARQRPEGGGGGGDEVVQNARDVARARQRNRERTAAQNYRAARQRPRQMGDEVVQNARDVARARQRNRERAAARNYREARQRPEGGGQGMDGLQAAGYALEGAFNAANYALQGIAFVMRGGAQLFADHHGGFDPGGEVVHDPPDFAANNVAGIHFIPPPQDEPRQNESQEVNQPPPQDDGFRNPAAINELFGEQVLY